MRAVDLLAHNPNPTEEEIRKGLEGNLCRCTGYHNIVRAVQDAARHPHAGQIPHPGLSPDAEDAGRELAKEGLGA